MATAAPARLPMVVDEVEVTSVRRLSPSFARIELGGPGLSEFGVDGPLLDQRIKLLLPPPSGRLPSLALHDEDWYRIWCALPDDERGHLRTYTVSSCYGEGLDVRVVVDIVLHVGAQGPGSAWAARVRPGDRVIVMGPRRGVDWGGIEFAPGGAGHVVLAGDETAVPAIGGILAGLAPGVTGAAFLEVPVGGDLLDMPSAPGVSVTWLPRHGAPYGSRLVPAVLDHFDSGVVEPVTADEVDPDLWETPSYSSSGEALTSSGPGLADCYAWVAGESQVVTTLRRALVGQVGLARRQVAFMGYWRQGVAMKG